MKKYLILSVLFPGVCFAKDDFSRADKDDLIEPIAASAIGTAGTEWLTGGGIQPDGGLVLAGVTIGPSFAFLGGDVTVLGPDTPPPVAVEWPMQVDSKGKPRLNRDGTQKRGEFSPDSAGATAFILRLSPDFQRVVSASRFPWGAGSLSSAVTGSDGAIYLAGLGNSELLKTLAADVSEMEMPPVADGKRPEKASTSYLAKLSSDGVKVEWVRYLTGVQPLPILEVLPDGNILFKGRAFDTYDAAGKQVARLATESGLNGATYDVNPSTGEFVHGDEHHWPTGREPWRCPELKIFHPDGSVKMQLYEWPGPLVGSDLSRNVSDSAVRNIRYTKEGDLLFSAWSDGGNSVMYSQPYNLFERAWNEREEGLRVNAAGAGAMSFSYVIKVDGETFKVRKGTLWVTQYKGVESTRVTELYETENGSVALGGTAYGKLYKTPNAFPEGPEEDWTPGTYNVSILNPEFDGLRFSSNMPGCGNVDLGNNADFRFFGGKVNGRELLVAVTGAKEDPHIPSHNPLQKGYAGGLLDGHFTVFEIPASK